MTERKVSLEHLPNGFELNGALTVLVKQDQSGCSMSLEAIPHISVQGETFAVVMQELRDSLIAAFENGDPAVLERVKRVDAPSIIPLTQVAAKVEVTAPKGTVYVLINKNQTLEGVVTDEKMANRFARWSGGSIEACVLDELKEN